MDSHGVAQPRPCTAVHEISRDHWSPPGAAESELMHAYKRLSAIALYTQNEH